MQVTCRFSQLKLNVIISIAHNTLREDYNGVQEDVQSTYFCKILFLLTDVAVGAPFEDNGAVYVYHGSRDGINPAYKQV